MKRRLSLIVSVSLAVTALCFVSLTAGAQPQDREYIKNQIQYHGSCRNVAITQTNGDLMLYGSNGWAANGCPKGLTDALSELNDKGAYIDDVQLTENGSWLILYGDNGFRWSNIPYSLEKKLREWNSNGEVVTSVTFNDDGDWIAISKEHISASDADIQNWISEGMSSYGQVWAACITDDAAVVVYAKGFKSLGDIPSTLWDRLQSTSINVYRLKIAGEAWFFSDGESRFDYHM